MGVSLYMSNSNAVLIFFLLVILLFCDAPFLEQTESFVLIRSGRLLVADLTGNICDKLIRRICALACFLFNYYCISPGGVDEQLGFPTLLIGKHECSRFS